MTKWHLSALLLATTILGGFEGPRAALSQESALVGTWVLDTERSDDVERAISGGTREVARVRMGGARGLDAASNYATRIARDLVEHLRRDASQLEITNVDDGVVVGYGDRSVVRYSLDGLSTGIMGDLLVETSATWQDDRLRLQARAPGSARVEETYTLDDETGSMEVEIRIIAANAGLNIRIRRTYDRAPLEPL